MASVDARGASLDKSRQDRPVATSICMVEMAALLLVGVLTSVSRYGTLLMIDKL